MRLLFAVAGVLSLLGSSPSRPNVQTLWTTSGPIAAFAQDGSLLAWFAPGGRRCNSVHELSLAGVKATLPKPATSSVTCRWDMAGMPTLLAVADGDGSALWTLHERTTLDFDYVVGADPARSERRFTQVAHTRAGSGRWLGGLAGDGNTLVYSVTGVAYVDQLACLSGGSCRQRVLGGGVHRVVGRRDSLVPGTGPALQVASAAGRVAYVPAAYVAAGGTPAASAGRAVEVRTAADGTLVSRIGPAGVPLALALAPHVLALLERSGGSLRIAWFDALQGTRLGSVRVAKATAPELSASDGYVVYRVGRVVHAVDVAGGAVRTLVTTAQPPVGLSLAGDRLAWAENVHGKGRIRAVDVRAS